MKKKADGLLYIGEYWQNQLCSQYGYGTVSYTHLDYSQKEQKHPITKAVLVPMKAVRKLFVLMELHLDVYKRQGIQSV